MKKKYSWTLFCQCINTDLSSISVAVASSISFYFKGLYHKICNLPFYIMQAKARKVKIMQFFLLLFDLFFKSQTALLYSHAHLLILNVMRASNLGYYNVITTSCPGTIYYRIAESKICFDSGSG